MKCIHLILIPFSRKCKASGAFFLPPLAFCEKYLESAIFLQLCYTFSPKTEHLNDLLEQMLSLNVCAAR
jgi:hypothetical protein